MSPFSDHSSSSRSPSPAQKKGKRREKSTQDPNWAYKPPHKHSAMKDVHDTEEWDWDAFEENKGLELWLIRVPDGVKPQHLENVSIQDPSTSKDSKVGMISSKRGKYDVFEYRDDGPPVGGEEIKNISCLLPRRGKKGELRLAPRPIARRLVVSSHGVKATPNGDDLTIPKRSSYSKAMLTHKFMPYGSHLPTPDGVGMEVEEIHPRASKSEPEPEKQKHPDDLKNKGKRKKKADETSSPKRSKKAKIVK